MASKRPSVSPTVATAAVLIVLGMAGMAVLLARAGWKPESITGFVTALALGLGSLLAVVAKMLGINADQSEQLAEIHENTNGRLDARIQAAVEKAVTNRLQPAVKAAVHEAYGAGRDDEAAAS